MADKELKLGLRLGVLGADGLKSAFGKTRRDLETLKGSTDKLTRASKSASAAQLSFASKGRAALASLKSGYDGLTASLGGLRMAAMALAAVPVTMSLNRALDLQDVSIDLAMGMGLDASAEKDLATLIQSASRSGNQTHADTGSAAQALVAGGVRELEVLGDYLPVLTKAATATRVGMQELTGAGLALRDNLGLDAEGFARSMNMLSHASTQGQMGVAAMTKALPQLTQRMKGLPAELNLSAEELMADLVAGMQVARMGANSDDEAARNLDAFMYRIFSPETGKRFESAGINLEKSIKNLTSAGETPMAAMLDTITQYVGSRGKGALKAFNNALTMESGEARDAAFSALNSRYALGDLFVDEGVKNFVITAMQNREMLQGLKSDLGEAAGQDVIGEDFQRRMTSGREQLKALRIQLGDIGATLGGPLAGALVSVTQSLMPVIQGFAQWASDNPGMVKALVATAGGLAGLRLGVMATGVLMRSGLAALGAFQGALSGMMTAARMLLPVLAGISWPVLAIGAAVAVVAGLVWKYWEPIKAFMVGVWQGMSEAMQPVMAAFAEALAPLKPLWDGIASAIGTVWGWIKQLLEPFAATSEQLQGATSAGQTFGTILGQVLGVLLAPLRLLANVVGWVAGIVVEYWDGIKRALSWTPLGLIVTHWNSISGFFGALWDGISGIFSRAWDALGAAVDGGMAGIAALILDWSPLGLFYKAFAGVMDWFGVELPDSFSGFGGMLIGGLWSGIRSAWSGIAGFFSNAWERISGVFSRAWDAISARISRDWDAASGLFSRAWESVSGFFGNVWNRLADAFDGGIAGIAALILDWSPLGLFYKAFAGVMDWFGVELPDSFSGFGGMLIDGLINGITGAFGKAKDAIVGIGESVTGWFRDTLGINSPSRVFMALGAGIPEGAAKGITAAQGVVRNAALGMATATAVTLAAPVLPEPLVPAPIMPAPVLPAPLVSAPGMPAPVLPAPVMSAPILPAPQIPAPIMPVPALPAPRTAGAAAGIGGLMPLAGNAVAELSATITDTRPERPPPPPAQLQAARMPAAPAQMTVQFSPTIQITAAAGDNVQQQVQRGLRMGMDEFRRMLREVEYQDRRTAFAGLSFANAPMTGGL